MSMPAEGAAVDRRAPWCPRVALQRARAVAGRWQPDYVGTEHLAITLLEDPAEDLEALLRRGGLSAGPLREALVRACDRWASEHGERPDDMCVGGRAPTPKLRGLFDACCPARDYYERCEHCPLPGGALFLALLRMPDTLLARELGDDRVWALSGTRGPTGGGPRAEHSTTPDPD